MLVEATKQRLTRLLVQRGFNLLAWLIPDQAGIADCAGGAVLLVANSGSHMWKQMPASWLDHDNPVDEYSIAVVSDALHQVLPGVDQRVLFPLQGGEVPVLQRLGRAVGWHNDSPLGLGIHPRAGLWFAYRCVVWVDVEPTEYADPGATRSPAETATSAADSSPDSSPCLTCRSQACVSSCPAQAIRFARAPDIAACAGYRLAAQSECAQTCLSRLACPVAPDMRYSEQQMRYHYVLARQSLQTWLANSEKS